MSNKHPPEYYVEGTQPIHIVDLEVTNCPPGTPARPRKDRPRPIVEDAAEAAPTPPDEKADQTRNAS